MDIHSWAFINELHKLQEQEGLRLREKLKAAHVNWKKQKMKVNLVAQGLRSSVADAIEFSFCKLYLYKQ